MADFLGGNAFIRLYSSGPANVLVPRPEPREKSVELYLQEYNRVGGGAELAEVLVETRRLLAAHLFHDIKNWPANMFYWWRSDSDSEAITQEKRTAIRQILLALLEEASR